MEKSTDDFAEKISLTTLFYKIKPRPDWIKTTLAVSEAKDF